MYPSELKYTEEHEWVKLDGDSAIVGITEFAAEELGEIVFCELPPVGKELAQMDEFGSVESVKTVSSLFLPLSGVVTQINQAVVENPSLINDSPYEEGWLLKVRLEDQKEADDLMTSEEYGNFLDSQ